jgi:sulfite exporter TauE/SafE
MSELPLIALAGLLGSSHCVGMCGGFVLSIGLGARGWKHNLARQFIYCAGRVFTYGFLGSVAGFAGFWFVRRSGMLIHAQAALSLVAGAVLVSQGLIALRLIPKFVVAGRPKRQLASPCLAASFLRPFLTSPRLDLVFFSGLLNGLLPCGLVYGYLALASSEADLVHGLAIMVAFGAGTVPIMILTGAGASVLSGAVRRRLFLVAGCCVLVTGLVAIGRGVQFARAAGDKSCPACAAPLAQKQIAHNQTAPIKDLADERSKALR